MLHLQQSKSWSCGEDGVFVVVCRTLALPVHRQGRHKLSLSWSLVVAKASARRAGFVFARVEQMLETEQTKARERCLRCCVWSRLEQGRWQRGRSGSGGGDNGCLPPLARECRGRQMTIGPSSWLQIVKRGYQGAELEQKKAGEISTFSLLLTASCVLVTRHCFCIPCLWSKQFAAQLSLFLPCASTRASAVSPDPQDNNKTFKIQNETNDWSTLAGRHHQGKYWNKSLNHKWRLKKGSAPPPVCAQAHQLHGRKDIQADCPIQIAPMSWAPLKATPNLPKFFGPPRSSSKSFDTVIR